MRVNSYLPSWLMFDLRNGIAKMSLLWKRKRAVVVSKSAVDEVESKNETCEKCDPKICESCRINKQTESSKTKRKEKIDFYLNQLNVIVFSIALFFMTFTMIFIWVYVSSGSSSN
jgi:hypothetical protein